MKTIRLNKLIADSGLASRRAADRLIADGHVTVNGKRVFELGIQIDPEKDKVSVDGKPLRRKFENIYLLLYKPTGVLTTMEDPLGRPTIADYLGGVPTRVFPVGRLDWDSEGLILLTNDGEFANKVTHPKEEVTKTYLVKLDGQPSPDKIQKLLRGVSIEGGRVAAKFVEKIKRPDGSDKYDWYKIIITEGKNRQIRQMFEKIGFDVLKLQRVAIGRLRLGSLGRGELVYLNDAALKMVFQQDNPNEIKAKKSYKGKAVEQRESKLSKSGSRSGGKTGNRPLGKTGKAAGSKSAKPGPKKPSTGAKSK